MCVEVYKHLECNNLAVRFPGKKLLSNFYHDLFSGRTRWWEGFKPESYTFIGVAYDPYDYEDYVKALAYAQKLAKRADHPKYWYKEWTPLTGSRMSRIHDAGYSLIEIDWYEGLIKVSEVETVHVSLV